jgi:hypothetical protein
LRPRREVGFYDLIFYTTEWGDSPLDDFLDDLDKKARAKVAAHLSHIFYFFQVRPQEVKDEKRRRSDIQKQVAGRP